MVENVKIISNRNYSDAFLVKILKESYGYDVKEIYKVIYGNKVLYWINVH